MQIEPTEKILFNSGVIVERWCLGRQRTNAYFAYGPDRKALVVDPGWDADALLNHCRQTGLVISSVVLTHAHFDHVGAAEDVSQSAQVPVHVHRNDMRLLKHAPIYGFRVDGVRIPAVTCVEPLDDGGELVVSDAVSVRAVHAPGHTAGGMFLFLKNAVFTGDTLLPDKAGRTDLPGGSGPELVRSLMILRNQLDPGDIVFPGHGATFTGRDAQAYIDRALTSGRSQAIGQSPDLSSG